MFSFLELISEQEHLCLIINEYTTVTRLFIANNIKAPVGSMLTDFWLEVDHSLIEQHIWALLFLFIFLFGSVLGYSVKM